MSWAARLSNGRSGSPRARGPSESVRATPRSPSGATGSRRAARTWTGSETSRNQTASLCPGQISRRIANRLNERDTTLGKVTRFVALPHTEGCGVSAGSAETIYSRTVLGYLASPTVRFGLLLEHGCEKTHNDYFRNRLEEAGLDPGRFGW